MPLLTGNGYSQPEPQVDSILQQDKSMPIAIVGMACRLPGEATNPDKLWDLCAKKEAAWSEVPKDRMNIDAFYHPDGERAGNTNARGGHFLKQDVAAFDASFFSIPPTEAKSIDPQQRILMECVYEAMENGGMTMEDFAGSDTSCYVGSFSRDYYEIIDRDPETAPLYSVTGNGAAILSNRISYFYDLKGPSLTLDTACSSSLVALHLACQSLRTGESHRAIVGATNLILNPDIIVTMSNMHFFSPDSRCFTFDSRANGYSRGEGIATLILKPLADAIRDNDTIRAVIRGTACNQDGKTSGIMLPSKEAQEELIRTAYEESGCDPKQTGYFEAHGTGTQAGDPLESGAIGAFFGPHRPLNDQDEKIPLYVGSVKTNIGHTEGTSGLAGVIKSVLALERGAIAPNLYFENPNPQIDLDGWNLRVPTELTAWPLDGQRRVSVNSFGFGGTNGHVILDDAYHYLESRGLQGSHRTSRTPILDLKTMIGNGNTEDEVTKPNGHENGTNGHTSTENRRHRIFLWSTHEENIAGKSGAAYAEHLAEREESNEEAFLDNLSYTLCSRRSMLPWKSFLVADSLSDLVEKVAATRQKPIRASLNPLRVAFVFTGQGAQWFGMGRELSKVYPLFQERLEQADLFIRKLGAEWSLLEELSKDERESRINESLISQTACTALQIALVDLLSSWEIRPTKVIGHSSGEIAAAYTAGILPAESALKAAYFRGLHSSLVKAKLPSADGAMMAVGLSEADAEERIGGLDPALGKAFVACINSPTNVTVSGDRPVLEALGQALQKDGVFARFLKVHTAYHSHHMEAVAPDYELSLAGIEVNLADDTVEMVSTVTGEPVTANDILGPKYWSKNMVSPVRFNNALQTLCSRRATTKRARRGAGNQAAVDALVEIGPHAGLAGPVKQILGVPSLEKSGIVYKSILSRGQDACQTTLEAVAFLFAKGYKIDLSKINSPDGLHTMPQVVVDLPTYFWNHSKRHWSESRLSLEHRFRRHARTDFLGYPVNDWNPMEPRWRNLIRLREQPWLKGHIVQGSYIYPGTGYICMAIEALHHLRDMPEYTTPLGTFVGYRLKDVKLSRALIIPASEEGVETLFSLRHYKESSASFSDTWYEFRAFSYSSSDGWAEHAHGLISAVHESDKSLSGSNFTYNPSLEKVLSTEKFSSSRTSSNLYDVVGAVGLVYEEPFRNFTGELRTNEGAATATVTVPDTKSLMPFNYEYPYLIHPATMDGFIQMLFPALLHGTNICSSPFMPVFFDETFLCADIAQEPGHRFHCVSTAGQTGFREVTTDVLVHDEASGLPMASFKGVRCSGVDAGPTEDDDDVSRAAVKKLCFHASWHPDPELLSKPIGDELMRKYIVTPEDPQRVSNLEAIAYYYYYQVLQQVKEEQVPSMKPHHQKFFRYMQLQRDLVKARQMPHQNVEWEQLDNPAIREKMEVLAARLESSGIDSQLICRVGRKLDKVLTGAVDPLALMLEDELLYKYYEGVLGYDILYRYAEILSNKNPNMKVLEIGGGTGGATAPILAAMGGSNGRYPRFNSYTFTDISSGFFEEAEIKFKDWKGLMEYRRLNIEEDPVEQGFGEQQYDLVVAASVLHATANIDRTLAHTRKLLKPGGRLILVEISNILNQVFLLFGCLPGWWMSEESYRPWGPTMNEKMWGEALKRNGFSDLTLAAPDNTDPRDEMGRVFSCVAVESAAVPAVNPSIQEVTLLTDSYDASSTSSGLEKAIEQRLGHLGIPVRKMSLSSISQTSLENAFCVSLAELDRSVIQDMKPSEFDAIKTIIKSSEGLLWVTEGAANNPSRPESALFHGLARSLRAEHESFPLITADLATFDRQAPGDAAENLVSLLQHILKNPREQEPEYLNENGYWWVNRCLESAETNGQIHGRINHQASGSDKTEPQPFYQQGRPLKLNIKTPGLLDTLRFEDDARAADPLGPDEVEIEVKASGVNFRDIMICTGQMSDSSLGLECAGTIRQIGSQVSHLKIGERVTAWTKGNYSNYARTHAQLAQSIPDDMSYAVAASLPIVFTTVIYGLQHIARLRKGESVLIHAAAGGVGQAAIILSQWIGADIFVTVGTPKKRELVQREFGIPENRIFSSRDLSFAQQIKKLTGGRGVDVVLNSLAGEALDATWDCIAMFGRFIEMGKKDIVDNRRLGMAPFLRNVTFSSIDLMTVFKHNVSLAAQLMQETRDLIRTKAIRPVPSIKTFPFSQFEEAFRFMQQGKHVGKIVMVPREDDIVQAVPRSSGPYVFPEDASYLITGFGGLGRSMARWMASRGAKNLIFASRSGVTRPAVKDLVDELGQSGVRVEVLQVDITDKPAFKSELDRILHVLPPVRGVIQAAMVLEDHIFENMSLEAFNNGIRPKVQGTWNLHEITIGQPLDFFIILASAVGVLGNSGQANYSAGNAFEDALAQYRRSQGLPAISIDLGMMLSVGAVAEDETGLVRRNLERKGFVGIEEEEFLVMLEIAIQDSNQQQHSQMITGIQTQSTVGGGEGGIALDEPSWKSSPVFSHLPKLNVRSSSNANSEGVQSTQALLKAALSFNDAVTIIVNAITIKLSRSLMIEIAELDPTRPTSAFGIDSLIAVELRNWFQKEMKADIAVFEILQANSLQTLAFRVAEKSGFVASSLAEA
ncbi:hypothetical protein L228DRAFT_284065 [Xylona heveae TC161]|uniref:Uncharacterized protein n=1 Tax=Xylona heveae (strain CBS 132557 / TC161) TaxID=1328760 RepID=A0A165FH84_XYLHT|nr:hypothetical protein L228DRAFT_284065 [Xylona heveae TC161]KZF20978.1 hypothetical protein L228DRAFT_284065 [Xylona heveae TC161]